MIRDHVGEIVGIASLAGICLILTLTPLVGNSIHFIQMISPSQLVFSPLVTDSTFDFIEGKVFRYSPKITVPSRFEIGVVVNKSAGNSALEADAEKMHFDGVLLLRYIERDKILFERTTDVVREIRYDGLFVKEIVFFTLNIPDRGIIGIRPQLEVEVLRRPTSAIFSRTNCLYIAVSGTV